MDQTWPEKLRDRLVQHKAELTERIGKIKADVARGLDPDSKERLAQLGNRDVLNALADEGANELAQINAALRRMDDGTYGICTSCGEEIDKQRLDARPYAATCIRCATSDTH
ncbi:MAG: TraR/DksA C4-type zinc finger protein [Gammaproteobacteria bacterium]|jgi:RNA polymerase-binding protein DksA|nr:TraR/DksA C4-type zinc finger protein [Gammaproteobacteria bacterium]MDP6616096.1 TraR/DksA C4-type zinc finger protein [Gammaproteobacteria bacterium]MDP6696064.1 TraR/DksA C4-type zinc finger protein [Gammaproteobacteria bacterium]MDP7042048.1 TraR/DksA C4-type zinc finger protein [Gammaproteobacteria bacterium]